MTYHTGPLSISRQFLRHKPVNKCRTDHEANKEPCSLDSYRGEGDGWTVEMVKSVGINSRSNKHATKRGRHKERVRRKHPRRRHGMDGKRSSNCCQGLTMSKSAEGDLQRRPKDQVDACTRKSAKGDIHPEQDLHNMEKPWSGVGDTVFTYSD